MTEKHLKLSITVPPDLAEALREMAEETGRSVSEAIRECVLTYLFLHAGRNMGEVAKGAIRQRMTNEDVLAAVLRRFPGANTTLASISWYRSKLRREDPSILTDAEARRLKTR